MSQQSAASSQQGFNPSPAPDDCWQLTVNFYMNTLYLFNTASRRKEKFKPIKKNQVGLYSCGPTVYNYAHIGNLRSYVFADILKRTLKYNGYKVKHVINITDVGHLVSDESAGEDKMIVAARCEKKTVWQIAQFYTDAFKKDIKKLNILPPDIWAKATDHIKEQIDLIKKLEKTGYTYVIEDGVYFDTAKFKDYPKFARLDVKGLKAGARIEMVKGKKNLTDFALWKFSPKDKQREMEWTSPWGKGFPGWHIECSAMSTKYLGEHFDIHTGGIDHIPVHHTNEIAQSVCATGQKFVNYWLHNDWLVIGQGVKMAKSGQNFIRLEDLINEDYRPLAYRYLLLGASYRSKLEFSKESLTAAQTALDKLHDSFLELPASPDKSGLKYEKKFLQAINDDLNTPQALAVVWNYIKSSKADKKTLLKFDKVLGLGLDKIKKKKVAIPANIKKLVQDREQARQAKNWKKADQLRNKIEKAGYLVEDTPRGPIIKTLKH